MKFISKAMIGIGGINVLLSLMQGFLIPSEHQADFATSARDYFLVSAVIFIVGLRMLQRSKQLDL